MSKAPIIAVLLALTMAAHAEEPPVRDPMRPFGGAGAAAGGAAGASVRPRFALTGVLIGPSRRVALVNGKPYTQGAIVDGAEIVAIEPGVVHLRAKAQPTLPGETVP